MFDVLGNAVGDLLKSTHEFIEDSADIATAVVTLGELGDLNKENIIRLINNGMTLYTIAEVSGVSVEVIEGYLKNS